MLHIFLTDLERSALNKYVGFLHTKIDSSSGGGDWEIAFDFDKPNCQYFGKHPSSWQLWLSDPVLNELKMLPSVNISVDGKAAVKPVTALFGSDKLTIDIPAGMGNHVWKLSGTKDGNQP